MKKMLLFPVIFSALGLQSACHASPAPASAENIESINRPEPVNSMLWRSGRPTPADYQMFRRQGILVIINIEDNTAAIEADAALAKQSGMAFYSFPLDPSKTPDAKTMDQIMGLLHNPKARTLVHCFHGQDRTGLVIGLERVFMENWKPQLAYQEMLKKGFHPVYRALDQYFKEKTASRL